MRAIFLDDLNIDSKEIIITGDRFHHVVNVVRIKIGEKILLLNGKGLVGSAELSGVTKREANVVVEKMEQRQRGYHIDLLQGITKREALEEIIRTSVETGINAIHPFAGHYAQKMSLNQDRIERIVESALIQSNNPFAVTVSEIVDNSTLASLFSHYTHILVFDLVDNSIKASEKFRYSEKILIVIGPEGGFSSEERAAFQSLPNVQFINLKTPILTAPIALPVAIGLTLSRFEI